LEQGEPTQHWSSLSSNPHQRHLEIQMLMRSHSLWRSGQYQSIPCTKQGGTGQEMMVSLHVTTCVVPQL